MISVASDFEIAGSWGEAQLELVRHAVVLVGAQTTPQQIETGSGFYFGINEHNNGKETPEVIEWNYDGYEVSKTCTYPAANWLLRLDALSLAEDRILGGKMNRADIMGQLCVSLSRAKESYL